MTEYGLRLVKSFVTAIDKLSISLHEHVDAVRANTKATEEANKQKAEQPPLPGSVAMDLNKPIAVTVDGETKTQVKNSWDWRDHIRLGAELIGLIVLIWYACTTRNLWVESHKQVAIMRKQLEATDRPWLAISVEIASPLTFRKTGDANIGFKFSPVNVGKSTATGVTVNSKVIVRSAFSLAVREVVNLQLQMCREIGSKPPVQVMSKTYFPGETKVWGYSNFGIGATDIATIVKASPVDLADQARRQYVPILFGCVDYRYGGFDASHQTGFIYRIQSASVPMKPILAGQDFPVKDLKLVPYEFGGDYAN